MSFFLIYRLANITQQVVRTQKTVVCLTEIKGITQNILNLTELHIKLEDGVGMGLVSERIEALDEMLIEIINGKNGILKKNPENTKIKSFYQDWNQFFDISIQSTGISDLFFSQAADELLTNRGLPFYVKSSLTLDNQINYFQETVQKLGKRAATAELTSEIFIAGFTIIILITVVFGGLVITRSITNPLINLSEHLKSRTLSQDQPFIDDNSKIHNELRTLIQSLEIQVERRTEELSESNRLLENEIEVRKITEMEVKKREKKYRQIFNNTAAWMAYTNMEGDFIETNITLMEHLGYRGDELKQMNLKELILEEDQTKFHEFIGELKYKDKSAGSVNMKSKSGKIFKLDYQSNVIPNDNGEGPRMVVHFAKDITQQEEAERAFKESELRFQDLVNTLPLAYFITDASRSLVFANRKTSETFKWIETTLKNQSSDNDFTQFLIPEDRQKACSHLDEDKRMKRVGWHRYSCQKEDGSVFPCEILTTPLKHGNEKSSSQHILVDISERLEKEELKKQKEIAEAANKAISEWLNFVAHELRNPLGGIVSYADFGKRKIGKAATEKIEKYFNQIHSSAKRMEILLTDLLDLSKMEIGQMPMEQSKTDLLAIVEEVQYENEALLIEKGLRLDIKIPKNGIKSFPLVCDHFRIGQVIRNLLSNSIKFTPAGKKITISYEKSFISGRRNSDHQIKSVQVNISDEGIGIPEDQLDLIFNKYRQSRKTRKGEGTGLGLPICQEIIHAHSGKIWVQSIENEGAKFSFKIPLSA